MDLTYTEEQQLLRDAVRTMCEKHSSIEVVRSLEGDEKGYSDGLWGSLEEMGLLELGAEGLPIEVSVVAEELGRALAPSPFIDSAVFAPALTGTFDGVSVLAWHEAERSDTPDGITVTFSDGALTGEKILVPFATAADRLLVVAREGAEIVIVAADPKDTAITAEGTLATDARYKVVFDGVSGEVVARGWDALLDAMVPTWIAVAAYALGAAERAHEISVGYANERVQFDKVIGSFQAMAHPLADLAAEIGGARAMVQQAAWALASGRDPATVRTAAAMAKYNACEVFRKTAKFGHQVFGGIGFTLDIDIQLFSRRAKQLEVLWFGPRHLEEIIASAELDAAEPYVTADAVSSAAKKPPCRLPRWTKNGSASFSTSRTSPSVPGSSSAASSISLRSPMRSPSAGASSSGVRTRTGRCSTTRAASSRVTTSS
jgi:alkylation response protein AidB-like acyl-CoA dehydrogenase